VSFSRLWVTTPQQGAKMAGVAKKSEKTDSTCTGINNTHNQIGALNAVLLDRVSRISISFEGADNMRIALLEITAS